MDFKLPGRLPRVSAEPMPQPVDALLARPPFRALVVPSKKIETLIEMNDTGFFCAQLQSQSVGYRADRFQITADECRTKPEVAPNKLERPRTPLESSIRPHSTFTATDRKSTRLNSSHITISYAVF